MDLDKLLSDLTKEKDRLGRAIEALVGSVMPGRGKKRLGRPKGSTTKTKPKKRKRGGLTPAGRKRLSIAMKKRWAERKKKSS